MKEAIMIVLAIAFFLSGCSKKSGIQNKGFQFDVCSVTYNGTPLPLDSTLDAWIKMFGKYNRRIENVYIWDSLGFFLFKTDEKYGDVLHICFENLESPIGQEGKLEWAHGRKSYEYVIKAKEEQGKAYTEQEKKFRKDILDKDSASKYPYPFKIYPDTVIVDGGMVAKGMSLDEVNGYRKKVGNKSMFGYWDKDMDEKNERGSTKVKTGEFNAFDMDREKQKCAVENKYYFLNTLRYTEGVLEYIQVQKVKKGNFYWRH